MITCIFTYVFSCYVILPLTILWSLTVVLIWDESLSCCRLAGWPHCYKSHEMLDKSTWGWHWCFQISSLRLGHMVYYIAKWNQMEKLGHLYHGNVTCIKYSERPKRLCAHHLTTMVAHPASGVLKCVSAALDWPGHVFNTPPQSKNWMLIWIFTQIHFLQSHKSGTHGKALDYDGIYNLKYLKQAAGVHVSPFVALKTLLSLGFLILQLRQRHCRCRWNHHHPHWFYKDLQVLWGKSQSHHWINTLDILNAWSSADLHNVAGFVTIEAETMGGNRRGRWLRRGGWGGGSWSRGRGGTEQECLGFWSASLINASTGCLRGRLYISTLPKWFA